MSNQNRSLDPSEEIGLVNVVSPVARDQSVAEKGGIRSFRMVSTNTNVSL